jgi:hypothetical protein
MVADPAYVAPNEEKARISLVLKAFSLHKLL